MTKPKTAPPSSEAMGVATSIVGPRHAAAWAHLIPVATALDAFAATQIQKERNRLCATLEKMSQTTEGIAAHCYAAAALLVKP